MSRNAVQKEWEQYYARTREKLTPVLSTLDYTLDDEQPHVSGERAHIRPVEGGRKLVLVGKRTSDGLRVIIKASDEPRGIQELEHERTCRTVLGRIKFAYQAFNSPKELLFEKHAGFLIAITEFIEQERSFIDRSIEEQFLLALAAFKAQESAHATTHAHASLVSRTFGELCARDYKETVTRYTNEITQRIPNHAQEYPRLGAALADATLLITESTEVLDQYGGFLTHWDFTPQNVRVRDGKLYLLDQSSLRFGNKYEGWARFVNFMMLYNPPLTDALVTYVRANRAEEESVSLRVMRAFRLVELIRYYAGWLEDTDGDLHELVCARITFWTEALRSVLDERALPLETVETFKTVRDRLRSESEKKRQKGLH